MDTYHLSYESYIYDSIFHNLVHSTQTPLVYSDYFGIHSQVDVCFYCQGLKTFRMMTRIFTYTSKTDLKNNLSTLPFL